MVNLELNIKIKNDGEAQEFIFGTPKVKLESACDWKRKQQPQAERVTSSKIDNDFSLEIVKIDSLFNRIKQLLELDNIKKFDVSLESYKNITGEFDKEGVLELIAEYLWGGKIASVYVNSLKGIEIIIYNDLVRFAEIKIDRPIV